MTDKKVKINSMLMIGSAGRNVGKTELACAIIKQISRTHRVVGLKVTTIDQPHGKCPHGGDGCGVCSSMQKDFEIAREVDAGDDKDTKRLLAAGATEVYWLRVLRQHLEQSLPALINTIGSETLCVCESNSLRNVLEPALFLMVKGKYTEQIKPAAQEVVRHADRIVTSDGQSFDLDIERITAKNNNWYLREEAAAIIMAGGAAKRMGSDKANLIINNKPIVEHIYLQLVGTFPEIIVSTSESGKYQLPEVKLATDRTPGQGPLMGIASALEVSEHELNFITACDIPNINLTCVRQLIAHAHDAEIVIPITGKDKFEPLFAVYRKSILDRVNEVLSAGKRRIREVFPMCSVKYIKLTDTDWLVNLNTPEQYQRFCRDCNCEL